jgi:DNA polymerase-3 subunit beta
MTGRVRGDISALESRQSSIIIPSSTLQEVLRVISQGADDVNIALEENQIFFEIGSTRIVSRLINGKYPEYQAIIPKQFSTEISLNQAEFQRALKIATSFSSYSASEVVFQFNTEDGWLEIKSQSQGIGEQVAKIAYEGVLSASLQIVFNPRYILEGTAALAGTEIRLALNTSSTPVKVFSEAEPDEYIYIVMPIRK